MAERRLALTATHLALHVCPCGAAHATATTAIAQENEKPGTTDWQLTRVRPDVPGGFRSAHIEGYCSAQSLRAGHQLDLMVSADPPCSVLLEVFRMGYYGGCGARLMHTLGPLAAQAQPVPPRNGERGLRSCDWPVWASIGIPEDWLSGVYLGRLSTVVGSLTPSHQSYVIFIVVDERPADILFQCSDNTWQAYNRWPGDSSLYTNTDGRNEGSVRDVYDVSFDRP